MDIQELIDMIDHECDKYRDRCMKVVMDSHYKTTTISNDQIHGYIGAANAAKDLRVQLLNALSGTN
jgi:hypothetical protein